MLFSSLDDIDIGAEPETPGVIHDLFAQWNECANNDDVDRFDGHRPRTPEVGHAKLTMDHLETTRSARRSGIEAAHKYF